MSLDDTVNLERLAKAFERIADALDRAYPLPREKRAAEIIKPGEDKDEQFNDRGSSQWFEETEQATAKSRFQERLENQSPESAKRATGPKNRRIETVSKAN